MRLSQLTLPRQDTIAVKSTLHSEFLVLPAVLFLSQDAVQDPT